MHIICGQEESLSGDQMCVYVCVCVCVRGCMCMYVRA